MRTLASIFLVIRMPASASEFILAPFLNHSTSCGGSGLPVALQMSCTMDPFSTYSVPETCTAEMKKEKYNYFCVYV